MRLGAWFGVVVWCGVVWCGVVWCGAVCMVYASRVSRVAVTILRSRVMFYE